MFLLLLLCLWFGQSQISPVQNQSAANAQQQTAPSPTASVEQVKRGKPGDSTDNYKSYASKWFEPLVVLNLLLFVGILVQAAIYWKQLGKMRQTLAVLTRQADAQDKQTGTMQGQLNAIEKQAGLMEASLTETRNLVEQNERAVQAAERSVEVAQKNLIYAQRAYVSITRGEVNWNAFTLRIENCGNTPASEVQIVAKAEVRTGAPPIPDFAMPGTELYSYIGLIAPRNHFHNVTRTASPFTPEQQSSVAKGDLQLWCSGIIRYLDAFGQAHHTKFCYYQEYGKTPPQPWVEGNEAD